MGSKAASKSFSPLGAARTKAAIARRAQLRLMRAVAKDVVYKNRETKWVCKSLGPTSLSATVNSLATVLNDVDAGDGESQRDGLKMRQLGISLRWSVTQPYTRNQAVRIMVLEEKSAFTSAELPQSILACVTPKMKGHFNVLHDHIYNDNTAVSPDMASDDRRAYYARYFRVNRIVEFPDGTGSNLTKGAISLWAIRDNQSTGAASYATISAEAICYFKEQ